MTAPLTFTIPGEPCSQGRPRAFRYRAKDGQQRVGMYDPQKSRSWKGVAQVHMQQAMDAAGQTAPLYLSHSPVDVLVVAVFTCPRGDYRKGPVPRRPHAKRGDAENIAKAVMDAATGILWVDDAQVARLVVEKWIGAQGEAPGVVVEVRPWAVCPWRR